MCITILQSILGDWNKCCRFEENLAEILSGNAKTLKKGSFPKGMLNKKTVLSKVSRAVLGGNLSISSDSGNKEGVFTTVHLTKKRFFS